MNDDDLSKKLTDAEGFFDAFKQMSELLNGAVATLTADGWTEAQARDLVVAAFLKEMRGNRP